jgi:hypothetical protein
VDLEAAELRLTAARDALASVPAHRPRDQLLDFVIGPRDAIRGKTTEARSVKDVKRALVENFESFAILGRPPAAPAGLRRRPDAAEPPDDQGVHAGSIRIEPSLRHESLWRGCVRCRGCRWPATSGPAAGSRSGARRRGDAPSATLQLRESLSDGRAIQAAAAARSTTVVPDIRVGAPITASSADGLAPSSAPPTACLPEIAAACWAGSGGGSASGLGCCAGGFVCRPAGSPTRPVV